MKISSYLQFYIVFVSILLGFLCGCGADSSQWVPIGELERILGPEDLSGICRKSGDLYWLVGDNAGELHLAQLALDPVTGAPCMWKIQATHRLSGVDDLEGVAVDPLKESVWVCDETGPAIVEYDSTSRSIVSRVNVPPVYGSVRKNRGFESLAISPDGFSLWACNENELGVDDDGVATTCEFVRLVKFTRKDKNAAWTVAGQWACAINNREGVPKVKRVKGDKIKGKTAKGEKKEKSPKFRNGVSDLCVLDDGRLLMLEREKATYKKDQAFRMAIYELDVTNADDVSSRSTLVGASIRPVAKRLVFSALTGTAMYEGLTQGPTLPDGSRTLIFVSDGEKGAAKRILVLRAQK